VTFEKPEAELSSTELKKKEQAKVASEEVA
jgi:hypothetical protein